MILRAVSACALLIVFFSTQSAVASTDNLTTSDVENFIKVSEELSDIEDRYPEVKSMFNQSQPEALAKMLDEEGNLVLFAKIIRQLDGTSAYREISSAVTSNGFRSMDEFSQKADRIMMAMVALEMENEDLSMMSGMTDDMVANLPPSMQAQIQAFQKLMKAVNNVPSSDIETLRPLNHKLQSSMD